MDDSATVAAADIARLAGVGRAAVSNWRRRFADFPAPVGGTSSSPLFSLAAVEEWLRRQGKLAEIPAEERVWQQIKASVGDLRLGQAVGQAGAFLVFLDQQAGTWRKLARRPDGELADRLGHALSGLDLPGEPHGILEAGLLRTIADLAAERSAAGIFDFVYERYLEAHSRRVGEVSTSLAALMVALTEAKGGVVYDPACGFGSVLMSAAKEGAEELFGQEREDHTAQIAAARLRLHGHRGAVSAGDAVRSDAFGSLRADAVTCVPPFGERDWGYDELATDVRWQYGLPPRGEPELPWVQHGLYHLKPGRYMAVVMPAAAANRRSGRRIRARLLRTGALRGIVALPAGSVPGVLAAPHLWILRRPVTGEPVPTHIMMADATDLPDDRLREAVVEQWQAFTGAGHENAVAVIDLLDEEVDLTPGRRAGPGQPEGAFSTLLEEMTGSVERLRRSVRNLRRLRAAHADVPKTTIAEQMRAGAVTVLQPPRGELPPGDLPVLTVSDVLEDTEPRERAGTTAGTVILQAGDVVLPSGGRPMVVRLVERGGAVLGPGLYAIRADRERIDPACLAGFLRVAAAAGSGRGQTGTSRADIRRVEIPRLPIEEQRRLGEAFGLLELFETSAGRLSGEARALYRLGLGELAAGRLV
ncbi:N-6 DNA methylase [Thermoactinospora rubra]|uniref:N-6 DNA methylase n=1 Tax=Thermoactinospora rubra TaxID=1088767 RepID=UPI000A11F1B2|nr:N-6 DNA methylase [Thermoactinospora rubra]